MLNLRDVNKNKMQFKVPQDVQREDTIIGPLTLKQMIIIGVGGGLAYGIYVSLSKTYFIEIWLPPVAIISIITLAFAFLKVHSLPFHEFLMDFIEYHLLPRKRIWIQGTALPFVSSLEKKKEKQTKLKLAKDESGKTKSLKELTEVLDTHGESQISSELSEEDKKTGLNKIINQTYKEQ